MAKPSQTVASRQPPDPAVADAARTHEPDRYLCALLAPADASADLVILAAYLGEIRRIPLVNSEPTIGEIRLQWWRDALAPDAPPSGNPIADAVIDMARRRGLDADLLRAPIEGRSREFYEDGIHSAHDWHAYVVETQAAPIRLALAIQGVPEIAAEDVAVIQNAAEALTFSNLALTLPQHLAHGRLPLPEGYRISAPEAQDPRGLPAAAARMAARVLKSLLADDAREALARFRADIKGKSASFRLATLPLALVDPYMRAATASRRDPLTDVVDISPLSRVARLWFAHVTGRL